MAEADKPVRESQDIEEIVAQAEEGELVGVADNAIVFRREVIVTDPDVKDRVAEALIDRMGPGGF